MKKKLILGAFCMLSTFAVKAQAIVDTVSLGAGYVNQVWYSLDNDEQGNAPKANWDLAFDVSAYGTSIHANTAIGTMIWTYPNGNLTAWNTIDTTGMTAWTPKYNSEMSWQIGALDQGVDLNNPFDIGWGVYNSVTHIISGDSIFIIKLANGNYKKLFIENLNAGTFNFKYANIDGSNEQVKMLTKSDFTGKNFGYFSLQNNVSLDREPVSSDAWDLVFTQYTAFIPTPYTVAGVLSNNDVLVAKAIEIADVESYVSFENEIFNPDINGIGYNWKAFNGTWEIENDLVFFVQSKTGDIWKMIFTGFGGSANGNYIFSKEKLQTASIGDPEGNKLVSLAVYPNPAKGNINMIYSLGKVSDAVLTITDLAGRTVYSKEISKQNALNTISLDATQFQSGAYVVSLVVEGQKTDQKLIIE